MRIIGLDYGDRTVGVAVSDPFGWTAQGLEVIKRKHDNDFAGVIKRLKEIIKEYNVGTIVLGYPINMNNTEGERCKKTLLFKEKLESKIEGLDIILLDERLSTVGAERVLLEADVSRAKRKKVIDKMAAVFILQGYLDSLPDKKRSNL